MKDLTTYINKGQDEKTNIDFSDFIENNKSREKDLKEICILLSGLNDEFEVKEALESINQYVVDYGRLFYSQISDNIFNLNEKERSSFSNNIDKVYQYSSQKDFLPEGCHSKTVEVVAKLYDHSNLAINQIENLKQSDEEFESKFSCKFESAVDPVKKKVEEDLKEVSKNMSGQLISLVAMFTAMSFLVFGGISSLDNIFEGARNFPLIKICIIGTIWGICIVNLITVFMFFVSKLIGKSIKSDESPEANLVQKYPLVFWTNFILIFILVVCIWIYVIYKNNLGKSVFTYVEAYPLQVVLGGSFTLLILFIIGCFCLLHLWSKGTKKQKKGKIKSLIHSMKEKLEKF
ncbi:MAG: hypothetical protein ACK5MV_00450 [Aminipila sp.]